MYFLFSHTIPFTIYSFTIYYFLCSAFFVIRSAFSVMSSMFSLPISFLFTTYYLLLTSYYLLLTTYFLLPAFLLSAFYFLFLFRILFIKSDHFWQYLFHTSGNHIIGNLVNRCFRIIVNSDNYCTFLHAGNMLDLP